MSAVLEQPQRHVDPVTGEIDSDFNRLLTQVYNPRDMLAGDGFERMLRLAEVMASGKTTVPKHLQGNVGDCMAVITQAMQWNMNPFAVAQKTHLVNGILGYEAQLVIAVLNASPLLASRIDFSWVEGWTGATGKDDKSDAHWSEVSARLRGETAPRVMRVSMAQVGSVRNSPLWGTDARQQLAYLAAKRWGRLHAPDVILGVYTPDELQYGDESLTASGDPVTRGPQRKKPTAPPAAPSAADASPAPAPGATPASTPASPPAQASAPPAGGTSTGGISGGQVAYLRNKLKSATIEEQTICDRFQVSSIELLNADQFDTIKSELLAAT